MTARGLPESNMRAIVQHLKTFKTVPEVVGMPHEWSNTGSGQKGENLSGATQDTKRDVTSASGKMNGSGTHENSR